MVINGFFNEAVDLIRDALLCIKEGLFFIVLPIESEIQDADIFPEISKLRACRVNDACYLVRYHKFQILHNHKTCAIAQIKSLASTLVMNALKPAHEN